MGNVAYTAVDRGEIASGHSASTLYNIDFNISQFTETQVTNKEVSRAMNGITQTTIYGYEYLYNITTDLVTNGTTNYDYWREFISSVKGGEQFELDLWGTNSSPDNPVTVIMDGEPTITRTHLHTRFSFTCIYNANF